MNNCYFCLTDIRQSGFHICGEERISHNYESMENYSCFWWDSDDKEYHALWYVHPKNNTLDFVLINSNDCEILKLQSSNITPSNIRKLLQTLISFS